MTSPASRFSDDARSNDSAKEAVAVEDGSDGLADSRQRYFLYCLQTYETPIALADVADEIAVYENETPITNIAAEEVKRVYMSLYHTYIPELVDDGLIIYNQDRDMVTLSEFGEQSSVTMEVNNNV